jgi:RimJ/RimL family protein N-acetyltransferase
MPLAVDHPILVEWRNSSREFFFDDRLITYESHMVWWAKIRRDARRLFWIIQSPDSPVGTISLKVDPIHRHGEYMNLLIAPEFRNQGFGKAGLFQLLKYGFETLELHRIFGDVLADNGPSLSVAGALKFQVEGVFRQHVLRGSKYLDVVRFGMLRRGYDKI